jgi:uncharacterized protein YprB with RNaseH-like and TPR domain
MDLRNRLHRIRALGKQNTLYETHSRRVEIPSLLTGHYFKEADGLTLVRKLSVKISEALYPFFPETLIALIPGLADVNYALKAENLVFFDIETTGLSGGAGTAVFLAAFGRFQDENYHTLKIEQYLLLDYPGETGFLRQITAAFTTEDAKNMPVAVSYNGKSFDSQIIKNRCLINGVQPPSFYHHADLLHTARSLWKKVLPSCSQGEIEKNILKIERRNDISGARAPDIWFSFLKTNDASELAGVCRHNILDIAGLASIFSVLNRIAHEPVRCGEEYRADKEALAIRLRKYRLKYNVSSAEIIGNEKKLLEMAAANGSPLAMFLLGKSMMQNKLYDESRALLEKLAQRNDSVIAAAADRLLALDSEWRMRDIERALFYTERTLARSNISAALVSDMQKRRERLMRKKKTAEIDAGEALIYAHSNKSVLP